MSSSEANKYKALNVRAPCTSVIVQRGEGRRLIAAASMADGSCVCATGLTWACAGRQEGLCGPGNRGPRSQEAVIRRGLAVRSEYRA